MTQAQLINLIVTSITNNQNNEITGDVLRPILTEIVNHFYDEVTGQLSNLNEPANTLVDAINGISLTGDTLTIYSGTVDPNAVAPTGSPQICDFFSLEFNGNPIRLYIYDGVQWIPFILTYQDARGIVATGSSYLMSGNEATIVYTGSNSSDTITLLDPALLNLRVITVVNQHNGAISFAGETYKSLTGGNSNTIPANSSITLQSNSVNWYRIK